MAQNATTASAIRALRRHKPVALRRQHRTVAMTIATTTSPTKKAAS
jgi:hypothetical protein